MCNMRGEWGEGGTHALSGLTVVCFCSGHDEDEEDEDMDVDAAKHMDEVTHALAAADALGKTSGNNFEDITDGLKELDMENYDEEDDGTFCALASYPVVSKLGSIDL